ISLVPDEHQASDAFLIHLFIVVFFFNDTPSTELYTLSLHDALPIAGCCCFGNGWTLSGARRRGLRGQPAGREAGAVLDVAGKSRQRLQAVHDRGPEADRAGLLEVAADRRYLADPKAEAGSLDQHLG